MTNIDLKKIRKIVSRKEYSHIKVSSPVSGKRVRVLNANVQASQVLPSYWDSLRTEILQTKADALGINGFQEKKKVIESHVAHAEVLRHIDILNDPRRVVKIDPNKYLYTHASIISSVNVEDDDHTIKVSSIKDINKNGDAWETKNLLATYKTFIGAYNYLEHVQIPAMRKGWIVDAVPRLAKNDDGEKFAIIDILVATERQHKSLIAALESGELNSMSMGCSCQFTICSRCGYVSANEMDVCNHIPREKLQEYAHVDGTRRYTAEICGHVSNPQATVFEEASWVFDPAFIIAETKKRVASTKRLIPSFTLIADMYETKKKILGDDLEDSAPLEDMPEGSSEDSEFSEDLGGDDVSEDTENFDEGGLGDGGIGGGGVGGPPSGFGGGGGGDFDEEDEGNIVTDDEADESLNIFSDPEEVPKFLEDQDAIIDKWYKTKLKDLETRRPLRDVDINQTFHQI